MRREMARAAEDSRGSGSGSGSGAEEAQADAEADADASRSLPAVSARGPPIRRRRIWDSSASGSGRMGEGGFVTCLCGSGSGSGSGVPLCLICAGTTGGRGSEARKIRMSGNDWFGCSDPDLVLKNLVYVHVVYGY